MIRTINEFADDELVVARCGERMILRIFRGFWAALFIIRTRRRPCVCVCEKSSTNLWQDVCIIFLLATFLTFDVCAL